MCDLTPNMTYKVMSTFEPTYKMNMYLGLCIYDSCRARFLNSMEAILLPIIANFTAIGNIPTLTVHDTEDVEKMQERQQTGFSLVTHLLYLLLAIGFIGIAVEYSKCLDKPGDQLNRLAVPEEPKQRKDKEILKSKTKWGLFFLSFSFTRNMRKLTTVGSGG